MPDSDDDEDDLTGVAAHERVQRAPRHVDEAVDAMADEYDDDAIGCVSPSHVSGLSNRVARSPSCVSRELDERDPRARGHASVFAFGAVLHAFRGSDEGAAALAAARAAALADRAADGISDDDDSDGDEEFDSDEDEDDLEEDSPEEREAKLARQVTRLRLGLPPSERLRTEGDEEVIEQLVSALEGAEVDDKVTELRPIELDARERERWVRGLIMRGCSKHDGVRSQLPCCLVHRIARQS
jgi:hypothetical protein